MSMNVLNVEMMTTRGPSARCTKQSWPRARLSGRLAVKVPLRKRRMLTDRSMATTAHDNHLRGHHCEVAKTVKLRKWPRCGLCLPRNLLTRLQTSLMLLTRASCLWNACDQLCKRTFHREAFIYPCDVPCCSEQGRLS